MQYLRQIPATDNLSWLCTGLLLVPCIAIGCARDVANLGRQSEALRPPTIALAETTTAEPVSAGVACKPVDGKSNRLDVWVLVRTNEEFYLHAIDEAHPDMIPLSVELELPEGCQLINKPQYSEPTVEHDYKVYRGDVYVHASVEYDRPEATQQIRAKVNYQACSAASCLPPKSIVATQ